MEANQVRVLLLIGYTFRCWPRRHVETVVSNADYAHLRVSQTTNTIIGITSHSSHREQKICGHVTSHPAVTDPAYVSRTSSLNDDIATGKKSTRLWKSRALSPSSERANFPFFRHDQDDYSLARMNTTPNSDVITTPSKALGTFVSPLPQC